MPSLLFYIRVSIFTKCMGLCSQRIKKGGPEASFVRVCCFSFDNAYLAYFAHLRRDFSRRDSRSLALPPFFVRAFAAVE